MKKIFILTGEPSGDKLAATIISKLKICQPNLRYLSVGGSHLNSLGINSIFDLKEITYVGFTSILFNIFKIRNRIKKTINEIIEFNPDILFSVDSPDFTLRVARNIKKINKNIKIIHFVAPQVWIWRKNRVKKMAKFIDHILLLFEFEKKYFDNENIKNTFVGHPLLENNFKKKVLIENILPSKKKIISIFPGSRESEIKVLLPILLDFVKLMNEETSKYFFIFHATIENKNYLKSKINHNLFNNIDIISDENLKSHFLANSIFAVSKSGTVSLQICNANVPSIIIYKLNFINFFILKFLVNVKFANIINIINNKEIIPELLQKKCNAKDIYNMVSFYLKKPELINNQLDICKKTLSKIKSKTSPSNAVVSILNEYLIS